MNLENFLLIIVNPIRNPKNKTIKTISILWV